MVEPDENPAWLEDCHLILYRNYSVFPAVYSYININNTVN